MPTTALPLTSKIIGKRKDNKVKFIDSAPFSPTQTPLLPSSYLINMLLVLPLLVLSPSSSVVGAAQEPYAQGNLFIIFEPKVGRQYDNNPMTSNLTELWCQATRPPGEERLRIKHAQFVHILPPPHRFHDAEVEGDRAHLRFGDHASTERIGKYRCEILTLQNERVVGNLFVYMRPIFHTNGSLRLDPESKDDLFHISSSSLKVTRGATAQLTCPAIGYPLPNITWYRDGHQIDASSNERLVLLGTQLHIRDVDYDDEGVYRCEARNAYPLEPEAPEDVYLATLDRHLRVSSSLSWVPPLMVIILILIALFIIIYACAAWKQYKHNQYNVAERERHLRKPEEQRLQDGDDDDE